jgi:hypothetical protein
VSFLDGLRLGRNLDVEERADSRVQDGEQFWKMEECYLRGSMVSCVPAGIYLCGKPDILDVNRSNTSEWQKTQA